MCCVRYLPPVTPTHLGKNRDHFFNESSSWLIARPATVLLPNCHERTNRQTIALNFSEIL